jgi:hypothetical protein
VSGTELLISDYRVYAGVEKLIEELAAWQAIEPTRRILFPFSQSADQCSSDRSSPSPPVNPLRGEFLSVYTRVRAEDGSHGDFLTASRIPANHVGGIRHASSSSQKMRTLLRGRVLRNGNFFEESIFQTLKGSGPNDHGLKFRRI